MDSSFVPATANPSVEEDALAAQPVGYWSGAVHRAVVNRLRDLMAGIDVTQPQWWVLTRVDAGDGLTREGVTAQLADVAETPDEVPRAIDQLLHRGWVEADDALVLHGEQDPLGRPSSVPISTRQSVSISSSSRRCRRIPFRIA